MEETEVKKLLFLMWHDKWVRRSVFFVFILFLLVTVSLSFVSAVIVVAAYITGFVVFNAAFSCQSTARNPLSLFVEKNLGLGTSFSGALKLCVVCGDGKCNRHKPNASVRQPWLGLNIPEEVDEAIEDFLNKTLQEYVYMWYGSLSADESFVLELRQCVRHAASVLLCKGLQVDLALVITRRLLPAGLAHLDDYLSCARLARRDGGTIEAAAVRYLGPRLHPAARTRDTELAYLRQLANLLMPNLLPACQLDCKSFSVLLRELLAGWVLLPLADVLADPGVVNSLLNLLLARHTLTEYPSTPSNVVEFLGRFAANPPAAHNSALRVDMASILKDQNLLYFFMQFLKTENCVNVLQFCLDVEEFNRKMLNPDLTPGDLVALHKEAWDLFSVYFSDESPDCLHFDPRLVHDMHAILLAPSAEIVKLRTTPPLYQAYERAYSQLETTLCPLFHQSDVFYTHMCGSRQPPGYSKSGSRAAKKWNEGGAVARLSSRLYKIKGALRAQPIEGSAYDADNALDLGETEFAEDLQNAESSYRDLSAWRVSIPSVEGRADLAGKPSPVFNIDVQRIDVSSEEDPDLCHWSVERRYGDFYHLESKLCEFHGDFADATLPPKRLLFEPRSLEFMQGKRQVFEQYLQSLLRKPSLRGSDLLHSFLRSPGEFVPGAGGDVIGRMIRRSVPLKLRKERGQHLEPFLGAFLASAAEGGRAKSSKYEHQDVSTAKPRRVRCLTRSVFGDNLGVRTLDAANAPRYARSIAVQGVFDSALYLLVRVFGASQALVTLALAVRTVCHSTADALARFYLDRRLRRLLAAPRLGHLVRLLQGAIFTPRSPPPTAQELERRAAVALQKLESLLPGVVSRWLGPAYRDGVATIFHALQNPALNKQLVYTLLDIVVAEMYPEFDSGIISPQQTEK